MSAHKRLAITVSAKRDIDDALLYTQRRWGTEQRRRYRVQLYQAMRSLNDFPERGQARNEYYLGCRCLPVEQHVVFYYLTDDTIVIDRVLHANQDAAGKIGP